MPSDQHDDTKLKVIRRYKHQPNLITLNGYVGKNGKSTQSMAMLKLNVNSFT